MLGNVFDWVADQFKPLNPSDGLDAVGSWFGGLAGTVGSDIKNYVMSVVKWFFNKAMDAIGWVESGFQFASHLLGDLLTVIRVLAQAAWDAATDIVQNQLPNLASFIFRAVRVVTDGLDGLIHTLINGAMSVINFVGSSLHNFVDWVQNTALPDIWGWIHGAFDWVYHNMILPLAAVFQRLYDELKAWANMAWGYISEAWNFVVQHGYAIADLILRASGWLIWMATHPFTFFLDLWNTLVREAPGAFIDALVRGIESEGSHVEDWVVNAFGR